uniref:RRM domain-containing protein n=1 Tax=Opuntia streptacantha TaxID=393608 RepID=A0A7C8Z376_OPUST
MDDMAAYYAPPPPPGIHSSLYSHSQYHHPPPPHQPSLATPPPLAPPLHHIPPPSLHSPPPSGSAFSRPSHSLYDEVRTLFVAGLPEDVKPREIYNLFREFPGYESSNLRPITRNDQPFAFAVFSDQQSAVAAMHALNGMVFDLEKGSALYIDLAKSNSRSKRQRADDEGSHLDKKFKGSPVYSRGSYDLAGVGSFHNPGMGNSAYNTIGYTSAQRSTALLHILITWNGISL